MPSTENTEWEEVPGATWADIREGWRYDYAYIGLDKEWRVVDRVISKPDVIPGGPTAVLLRAWKPVEKPKPTVAFVTYTDGRVGPAYKADSYYYEAKTGQFIDHEDEVNDFVCEGVVVPAGDLAGMRHAYRSYGTYNSSFRDMADAFFRKCEELGVFGHE